MGRTRRPQPKKLRPKLREIRTRLGLTQEAMAKALSNAGAEPAIHSGYIADFESGKREPSLLVILAYAAVANISTDLLIDDDLDLPEGFPRAGKKRK